MKINAEVLSRQMAIAGQFVSARSTLLVLSFIKWGKSKDGTLVLSATDLEHGVVLDTKIPYGDDMPGVGFCVPAKQFLEMLKFWVGEMNVTYSEKTARLNVSCGGSKAQFNCLAGDEFPPFTHSSILGGVAPISYVTQADFASVIGSVAFASSNDNARPVLEGMYLQADKDVLQVTCADGFRLAHNELAIAGSDKSNVIISAKNMALIAKLFQPQKVNVTIIGGTGMVIFSQPKIEFHATRIDGAFPDYPQIVPKRIKDQHEFIVDRASIDSALRRVKVLAGDSRIVRITVNTDHLMLSTEKEEIGNSDERVELSTQTETDGFLFALNVDLFVEAIAKAPDTLIMRIISDTSPLMIESVHQSPWYHVIMPMHLGK